MLETKGQHYGFFEQVFAIAGICGTVAGYLLGFIVPAYADEKVEVFFDSKTVEYRVIYDAPSFRLGFDGRKNKNTDEGTFAARLETPGTTFYGWLNDKNVGEAKIIQRLSPSMRLSVGAREKTAYGGLAVNEFGPNGFEFGILGDHLRATAWTTWKNSMGSFFIGANTRDGKVNAEFSRSYLPGYQEKGPFFDLMFTDGKGLDEYSLILGAQTTEDGYYGINGTNTFCNIDDGLLCRNASLTPNNPLRWTGSQPWQSRVRDFGVNLGLKTNKGQQTINIEAAEYLNPELYVSAGYDKTGPQQNWKIAIGKSSEGNKVHFGAEYNPEDKRLRPFIMVRQKR